MKTENLVHLTQGLYSLSGKTSYRKISWSLEATRFGFKLFQSLWNLAGTSAALLPRCLSNFRAIRPLQHPISRLRDFTRFGGKTSYRLVNRGPGYGLLSVGTKPKLTLTIGLVFLGMKFLEVFCSKCTRYYEQKLQETISFSIFFHISHGLIPLTYLV